MDKQQVNFDKVRSFVDELYFEYQKVVKAWDNINPVLVNRISINSKAYHNLFITAEFEYLINCSELLKEIHSKLKITKELADTLIKASPEYAETLETCISNEDFLLRLLGDNYSFKTDEKLIREVLLDYLNYRKVSLA
jgi:hypothetical protein